MKSCSYPRAWVTCRRWPGTRGAGARRLRNGPPGTAELLKLWNNERRDSADTTIMSLYWDVSIACIGGVLEQIRKTLVRLLSEMRAAMPDDSPCPLPSRRRTRCRWSCTGEGLELADFDRRFCLRGGDPMRPAVTSNAGGHGRPRLVP